MNVFEMREGLVRDYGSFVRSFVDITDQCIGEVRPSWAKPVQQTGSQP
jgi:hypothetical protein